MGLRVDPSGSISYGEYSRSHAAQAPDRMGVAAKEAVRHLSRALRDDSIRWAAAQALGRLGPEARAAVPALIKALKDGDWLTRLMAAAALEKVDPEAAARAER
jgi:HEAT repeat protein